MRLVSEGQCPHCGITCSPYYECEQRRAYKRNRYIHKGNWGGVRRGCGRKPGVANKPHGDSNGRLKHQNTGIERNNEHDLLPKGVFPTERISVEDDYLGWEKSSPWLLP